MVYDAIVLGLGAAGSATTYQLTRKGKRVLAIDRYSPPHDRGSSHGGSRITRLAVAEGEAYAPIVSRSHEIWREIEERLSCELMRATGGLILGRVGGDSRGFLNRTIGIADKFRIPHELLDANELRRRFPQFVVDDDEFGYFEPTAGFLDAEGCVDAQLALARLGGAEIHPNERGLSFDETEGSVRVITDHDSYEGRSLVLCVGPWAPQLLGGGWRRILRITQETQFYFETTNPEIFLPDRFPVFIWEVGFGQSFYGFPAIDGTAGGIKITLDADVGPNAASEARDALAALRALTQSRIAGLSPRLIRSLSCSYTSTPDSDFIIDRLPGSTRIFLLSACSGHGFKHSAAIGEIVSDLVVDGRTKIDISGFRADRFN